MKVTLIKYLKKMAYLVFLFFVCLVLLEICFRHQFVDFYQSELSGLNTEEELNSKGNNVLVFGDSFSAHPDSYVKKLREELPAVNLINTAIPGTGINQHELLFKKRIKKYQPKAIIYQFYVGNDFTDINHPINFEKLSFLRNVFWKASERFLILQYINHRLAFLNKSNQPIEKLHEAGFSKEKYNNRVKTYYRADNTGLENTILLSDQKSKNNYDKWRTKLVELNRLTGDSIPVVLLIVQF